MCKYFREVVALRRAGRGSNVLAQGSIVAQVDFVAHLIVQISKDVQQGQHHSRPNYNYAGKGIIHKTRLSVSDKPLMTMM